MINELLFAIAMSCNVPKIENRTKLPWNETDKWNLDTAMKNCGKFYPKSPCLKVFIKTDFQSYRAICSKEI